MQVAEWFYTHHSLHSFQHYQNADRHNADDFPVYMVSIVGL